MIDLNTTAATRIAAGQSDERGGHLAVALEEGLLQLGVEVDIDDGTSRDCNFNGVPDECETLSCPADYTGPEGVSDGVVNILEFLLMLAQWGGTGCADFWGPAEEPDGVVDVLDFLALLAFWGPCP